MTARIFPADAVTGAPSYTGRYLRQTHAALCGDAPVGRPLGAQSGVRAGTPATTVSATSTTWTVTPHAGVLDLEAASIAGPYLYAFDANVTGSMTAANATNPRIDLISVQLSDPAESDGTSAPGVGIVYTTGTAAPSPVPPATPTRSLALAQINVPVSGGGSPSTSWIAPTFGATPAMQVVAGSAQNLLTATFTTLVGYTATAYSTGLISYTTGVYTAPPNVITGLYRWELTVTIPPIAATSHRRLFRPVVNGSIVTNSQGNMEFDYSAAVATTTTMTVGGVLPLNAGDQLTIQAYQSSGSTIAYTPNAYSLTQIG